MATNQSGNKTHVLVTGGAGYIGSLLVPLLLSKNYRVTVYDLFNFGAETLLPVTFQSDLILIKGDIRDEEKLKKVMQDVDVIIHLAGIVGYPACSKDPELAISTNIDGTKNITKNIKPNQKLIFSSTGSCYGAIPDGFCTEETPLSPVSLYGSSKADGEKLVREVNGVNLRLATIFGASPRIRLDLLINFLTLKALTEKNFDVYEAHFRRTFLHVRDVCDAFLFTVENFDKMKGETYNVGGDKLNFTKQEICDIIQKKIDCTITPSTEGQDADKRDYKVSYEKIRKLGFEPKITIEEGVDELIKVLLLLSPGYMDRSKNA